MYLYMYNNTYMCTYVYTCMHVRTIHTYAFMNHTYIRINECTHTHTKPMLSCIKKPPQHRHTQENHLLKVIYTYIKTPSHTCTHIHMHTRAPGRKTSLRRCTAHRPARTPICRGSHVPKTQTREPISSRRPQPNSIFSQ
jgi:hypothetical protein